MKIILCLGMFVIFISCFFIFFTFDSMVKAKFVCNYGEKLSCNVPEINTTIVFGIIVVGMFLFIDTLVLYVMMKAWVPDLFIYGMRR